MITATVGAAGDFAGWVEVWNYLVGLGALLDDYEFRQISDVTINNNWPYGNVTFNSHTVRWYVAWEDSHQGDPTQGFVTYLNGAAGLIFCRGATSVDTDVMEMENLYLRQTSLNNITLLTVATGGNLQSITCNQNNLLIRGFSEDVGRGVAWSGNRSKINFSNSKIWNIKEPFYGNLFTFVGGDDTTGYHIAENITVGQHKATGGAFLLPSVLGMEWILRNCVATGGNPAGGIPTYDWVGLINYRHQVYNCAGSDGSLTTAIFLVKDDPQDNIVEADEFESIDDTNAAFWFLKNGNVAVSFTRDPNGTLWVNQECKFDPEVLITPGALRLGETGIASTLETEDIAGEPRPGPVGFYSIGAHQQHYG